jgi:hypothetical protein
MVLMTTFIRRKRQCQCMFCIYGAVVESVVGSEPAHLDLPLSGPGNGGALAARAEVEVEVVAAVAGVHVD